MNAERSLVLLGAGHTHLHVLREWRTQGVPGVALTCVSDFAIATYSGMLTAVMAGEYSASAMQVELGPLCGAAGATLRVGHVSAVQLAEKQLLLSDGRRVSFDVLSIGVGSASSTDGGNFAAAAAVVLVKPMQTFMSRLRDACVRRQPRDRRLRVVVVGGGAAAVEIVLGLAPFLSTVVGSASFTCGLVASAPILPDCSAGLQRRAWTALERSGVQRCTGRAVAVGADAVQLDDDRQVDADVVIWATGAAPPAILQTVDLPKDPDGFLLTTNALCSTGDPAVFAVGDTAAIEGRPIPKAGVYAVRQGPVLLDNLRRAFAGRPLRPFAPQPSFLKLLNVGGGEAIGEWHGLSFEGAWCRRLKDVIDRRFVARYQLP
ncbi:MAG: FAD-dependent oxidoreductase [Acidobacteriota bacterium]